MSDEAMDEAIDSGQETDALEGNDAAFEALSDLGSDAGTDSEVDATPEVEATPKDEGAGEPWAQYLNEGESVEAAFQRLVQERDSQHGRAAKHWDEYKQVRDELKDLRTQLEPANQLLELMRRRAEEQEKAAYEEERADPELEPGRAAYEQMVALREQLTLQQYQQEQAALQAQEQTAQEEYLGTLAQVDGYFTEQVLGSLGQLDGSEADPEFVAAFGAVEKMRVESLREEFPEATEAQIAMAAYGMRVRDSRILIDRGIEPVDWYKQRHKQLSSALGVQIPDPPPPTGGMTAGQVKEKAAKGQNGARRVASSGHAVPKDLKEFSALTEDQRVALMREHKISDEDVWGALGENYAERW